MKKLLVTLSCAIALLAACSEQEVIDEVESILDSEEEVSRMISQDEAISTLMAFLEDTELPTRSGKSRTISSVSVYSKPVTKAQMEDATESPSAYLVNFDDDEGFAVLGATTDVPDIVAVVESGHIEDDLTIVVPEEENESPDIEDEEDEEYEMDEDSLDMYCAEDGDYYSAQQAPIAVVGSLISTGLDEEDPSGEGCIAVRKTYTTRLPILKTNWDQNPPYNKYCRRRNLAFKIKSALAGCSNTALAMIMTAMEYPDTLIIRDTVLDWQSMKMDPAIRSLSPSSQESVSLLLGYIFYNVNRISLKKSTLITPEQIKKLMSKMGYPNVQKLSSPSFSDEMLEAVSDMLKGGRPVFLSAIPKKLVHAHSWVVDGAKYSSTDKRQYLLHFNFGWSGKCNGYFSTNCLNPAKGIQYDNPVLYNTDPDKDYVYMQHFRLVTYDRPLDHKVMNVSFKMPEE